MKMAKAYSRPLKTVFLVHAIVAGLVGIQHMIVPELPGLLAGVELPSPILYRVLGAAVFGFAVSSWMAYREKKRENIRIILWMEII